MDNLKIVEYKPELAGEVARMWRKSISGWNGGGYGVSSFMLEENILKQMENTTSINVYLAEMDGEVLGYCDFQHYMEDEGALYIKWLNVRDDYHGRGIGKKLVCRAVERTLELEWPRLDLYTWAGNTKSIPLYKKCGFFLEDRNDITHLMNFIPYAVNTEAVKEYFKYLDWYKDLKRNIDINPDGRNEGGFCYYEYLWEGEGKFIRMEFERNGRGLRLIETHDYCIIATLPRAELVFGQKYEITYEIYNKTGRPLTVSIEGRNDKNIEYDFNASVDVASQKVLKGEFYVGEYNGDIDPHKTHPVVSSRILVNGKSVEFKTGVVTKPPAELSLSGTDATDGTHYRSNDEVYKNSISNMYLNISNSFDERSEFLFKLAGNKDIEFLCNEFDITLEGGDSTSIEIPYILKNHCFYSEKVEITASMGDGRKVKFNNVIKAVFKGRDGNFGGEERDYLIANNGEYSVRLSKLDGRMFLRILEDDRVYFCPPKLGKPYSSEFSTIKPFNFSWQTEGEDMLVRVSWASEQYKGILVHSHVKISPNGIFEGWHEVQNISETDDFKDLYVLQEAYMSLTGGILPINGRYVEIQHPETMDMGNFDMERLTESWIFSSSDTITRAIWWNSNIKAKMDNIFIGFEHPIDVKPLGKRRIESISIALNTFRNWKEFKSYVDGKRHKLDNLVEDLEISVNDGNPFTGRSFEVELIEHKLMPVSGEFTFKSEKGIISNSVKVFQEENLQNCRIPIDICNNYEYDILKTIIEGSISIYERRNIIFNTGMDAIKKDMEINNGLKVYSLDNGIVSIKACPDFSPGIYSAVYGGREWLETSFPKPVAKSWYNPWTGGIFSGFEFFSLRNVLQENIEMEFVDIEDSLGNTWTGIKTFYNVEKDREFMGLGIEQYFLMLPGSPVLCHTTKIQQNMKRHVNRAYFQVYNFLGLDKNPRNNYFMMKDRKGIYTKYKCGGEAADFYSDSSVLLGNNNFKDKLQIFSNHSSTKQVIDIDMNNTSTFIQEDITCAHGGNMFTRPVFYIFTDNYLDDESLKDLNNIYFI